MELRLQGHLSRIQYGKLRFTYLRCDTRDTYHTYTDDTKHKLERHCGVEHVPYDAAEFTVCLPSEYKNSPPADIMALVGLDCTLLVRVIPYKFISRLAANAGQQVNGTRLVLQDISMLTA
jgi:hypothetical protein